MGYCYDPVILNEWVDALLCDWEIPGGADFLSTLPKSAVVAP